MRTAQGAAAGAKSSSLLSLLVALMAGSDQPTGTSGVGSKADIGGPPLNQFSFVNPRP